MTLAVGVNHVVVHDSDNALCGTTVVWPSRHERPRWHAATNRTCPDCVTVLAARAQQTVQSPSDQEHHTR
jgi:hypothetical protein